MSSQAEHIIRVTADRSVADGREPIVKDYTVAEIVKAGYDWGRMDGKASAEGNPLFGVGEDWTVVAVPLSELRAKFEPARRDG